ARPHSDLRDLRTDRSDPKQACGDLCTGERGSRGRNAVHQVVHRVVEVLVAVFAVTVGGRPTGLVVVIDGLIDRRWPVHAENTLVEWLTRWERIAIDQRRHGAIVVAERAH